MKVYVWEFEEQYFDQFAAVVGTRGFVSKAIINYGEPAIVSRTDGKILVLKKESLSIMGMRDSEFAARIIHTIGAPDGITQSAPSIKTETVFLNNFSFDIYDKEEYDKVLEEMYDSTRDLPIIREFLGLPPEEPEEPEAEETEEPETRPLKRPTRPRAEGKPRVPRNQKKEM